MDGTDYFMKKYNIPKPEIKKNKGGVVPRPEAFKDYEELCKTFILWFEEFSGRRVNIDQCIENLVYFFDQGFEIDEMIDYVRARQKADYYLTNPDMFTIRILFPVKDADQANATWDRLAFYQSVRKKTDKIAASNLILMKCGHSSDDSYACSQCIQNGDDYKIMKSPYHPGVPDSKKELADHFKRQNEETLHQYGIRTFERRKLINAAKGHIVDGNHIDFLKYVYK